ncbi:dTDP-4-dehydrorhamnose 3,5-epimerase [Vibrio cholerae]
MKVIETKISEVKIIEVDIFGDERGFFMESWNEESFCRKVANRKFVQDNHSKSVKGTLRGLHFQTQNPQGKLVRVISGEVFDVAVDLRPDSPTFGDWVGVYLSSSNKRQLWIPEGFAHGFYVISDTAEFVYKCTNYYHPESERSLLWCDKSLDIEWPIVTSEVLLSNKDKNGELFIRDKKYF